MNASTTPGRMGWATVLLLAVAIHYLFLIWTILGWHPDLGRGASNVLRHFDPLWLPIVLIPEIAFASVVFYGHHLKGHVSAGRWATGIAVLLGLAFCFPVFVLATGGQAFSGIPLW